MGKASVDFRAHYAKPLPDGSLDFSMTQAEREAAAFAQAQLRFEAMARTAADASLHALRGEAAHG